MPEVTVKELMEAGVHYGHQTSRWNPKMKPYIYAPKNGIYIINVQKTSVLLKMALNFIEKTVSNGKEILFVGTKKQAQQTIVSNATKCEMPYVTNRWLGGTLTNFSTIRTSVERMKKLDRMKNDGGMEKLPKKEVLLLNKELDKLEITLGGIKNMSDLPGVVFIVDPIKEKIAVSEAYKLGIPIVAIVDTNADPDKIDYLLPGNDDAIRSIQLFTEKVTEAVISGKDQFSKKVPERTVEASDYYGEKPDVDQGIAKEDGETTVVLKRKNQSRSKREVN